MRIAILMLGLALSVPLAHAAETAAPPRTIKSLVDLAMEKGTPGKTGKRTAKMLNIAPGTPDKAIWFDQGTTPDGNEYEFNVILKDGKPIELLWMVSKITETDGKKFGKGYELEVGLDGTFKDGWEFEGVPGKTKDSRLKKKRGVELAQRTAVFWTKDSVSLAWGK